MTVAVGSIFKIMLEYSIRRSANDRRSRKISSDHRKYEKDLSLIIDSLYRLEIQKVLTYSQHKLLDLDN